MSRGELMYFADCPAKWLKNVENEDTKATAYGDLIDSLLLTPAKAEAKFAVTPDEYEPGKPWNWNAKKCQAWRDEKEAAGQTVTTSKEMKRATTALQALLSNKLLMELVECSKTQVMAVATYKDTATGIEIPLKVLLDLVPDKEHPKFGKSLGDFKTTKNAAMFEFGRDIDRHHYDAQAALYALIYATATGEDRIDWRIAVQESVEPFHSEIYTLDTAFIENGLGKISQALKLYCWCLKNGQWPGYGIVSRMVMNGIPIIQAEDWMTTKLADFCRIPEIHQTEAAAENFDNLP